ncbi:MAG: glycosyltransferase family 39 protein [Pirellulales bacterium]|nr:glycosyltransferase family 39 protein [Pirellulales bacterium]
MSQHAHDNSISWQPRDYAALALVVVLATGMLFWRLGERAMWQDEAATALLAERMLEQGRPLAYDGRNLITMDVPSAGDTEPGVFARRTGEPNAAVAHYAARGDYKPDTTWIGQPWGQFVLAGASLGLLGHGTWQARLPFALCGWATVVALWFFVRRRFDDRLMATLAACLLLANVYWVLHMRQCRYYAPACLFFFLTYAAYLRWQEHRRHGALWFVGTAWLWFQFDYGTFWPIVAILGLDALVRRRHSILKTLATFAALAVSIAPWVYYYEILSRVKPTVISLEARELGLFFYFNQFLLPVVLLPVIVWVVWRARREQSIERRQALGVALAIVASLLLWAPLIVPAPHLRYLIGAAPLACLLMAFTFVELASLVTRRATQPVWRAVVAAALAGFVMFVPWLSNAALVFYPSDYWVVSRVGTWLRAEWITFFQDIGGIERDQNGEVVELLQSRLRPGDEILTNYEDIPLMFYLDRPIRGGLAGFRINDTATPPPRFVVIVESAEFLYSATMSNAFRAAIARHTWREVRNDIPAFRTSNCPDPFMHPGQWGPEGRIVVLELDPSQGS